MLLFLTLKDLVNVCAAFITRLEKINAMASMSKD